MKQWASARRRSSYPPATCRKLHRFCRNRRRFNLTCNAIRGIKAHDPKLRMDHAGDRPSRSPSRYWVGACTPAPMAIRVYRLSLSTELLPAPRCARLAPPSGRLRAFHFAPSTELADGHTYGWPSQTTFVRGGAEKTKAGSISPLADRSQRGNQRAEATQMGERSAISKKSEYPATQREAQTGVRTFD